MIAVGRALAPMKIGRCLLCVAGLVVALVIGVLQDRDHSARTLSAKVPDVVTRFAGSRKVYPLSVIGGGAYSAEELNRARRLDSVVRAHYVDFGRTPVVQQTPKDLLMYVSYRKSDAVYWTRTKRHIPKGELVLSDSQNLARVRCGNRLSFTPQQPTGPEQKEPSEEALNTPETPEISIPSDAPPPPATEADLYVPADPLPAGLLSHLPSPSPLGTAQPVASPWTGGAYAPMPGWGTGSLGGGIPFLARGSGFPVRANGGSGASTTGSIVSNLIVVNTPEPGSAKLLLLSILILGFFWLRGRIRLSL